MADRPYKNLKISVLKKLACELQTRVRNGQDLLDAYDAEIQHRYTPKEIKSHE